MTEKAGGQPFTLDLMASIFEADRKPAKIATIVAICFHLLILWVVFPEVNGMAAVGEEYDSVIIRMFKLPDFPESQKTRTARKARTIPFPDPTPDALEPLQGPVDLEGLDDMHSPDVTFEIELPDEAPQPAPRLITGGIIAPEVIKRVEPEYNETAEIAGIEGFVILECVIGKNGSVRNIKVLRSLRLLDEEAVKAVKQWEFLPATLHGKPVDVYFVLTVEFKLKR